MCIENIKNRRTQYVYDDIMINALVNQMGPMHPNGPMWSRSSTSTIWLWIIIGLLVIIIVYLWYKDRRREVPDLAPVESLDVENIDVAMRLLNPNEKLVVEYLINNDGEMLQKDIHYELDLTRVQAHRVVQGLVQKNIVTVEDHYNTKKILLAEWFLRRGRVQTRKHIKLLKY
jgi:DNA-binding MarR family transcriptional regulator